MTGSLNELAELNDRHRLLAAFTALVDPQQRVRGRLQYDYTIDDTVGSEHAAWFEIQIQWGGTGGSTPVTGIEVLCRNDQIS